MRMCMKKMKLGMKGWHLELLTLEYHSFHQAKPEKLNKIKLDIPCWKKESSQRTPPMGPT